MVVWLPGKRAAKLDANTASGIFLGYTATDDNIYYQDYTTKKIKVATHVSFDKAGYTNLPDNVTIRQQQLRLHDQGGQCDGSNISLDTIEVSTSDDPSASVPSNTTRPDNAPEKQQPPSLQENDLLASTERGANDLGSPDDSYPASRYPTIHLVDATLPQPQDSDAPHTTTEQILHQILVEDNIKPYNIWFSNDPYHKWLTMSITFKDTHPMLGLVIQPTAPHHRLQIHDMEKGTPASRLP